MTDARQLKDLETKLKQLRDNIEIPQGFATKSFQGAFLEGFNFVITSNGTTITGTLQSKTGGDLTMHFADGLSTLDCTPAITITLTPGTATNPQTNYVYVDASDKTVKLSTSEWLTTEHIKIAQVALFTASKTQTDGGAMRNQNWNDHLVDSIDMGHIQHISERIRQEPSRWNSGAEGTMSAGANTYISVTAGTVYQMHKQNFPAFSMPTDDIHLVNSTAGAYTTTTNLNTVLNDSTGATIKNKHFSVVLWGVQNSGSEQCHIMLNLPGGSYNSSSNAIADADGYSDYSIPDTFNGVGFLIARFTVQSNSSYVWTLNDTQDLRGYFPNSTAGGGGSGGGGVTTFTALTDTPSAYTSEASSLLRVNAGETALEFRTPAETLTDLGVAAAAQTATGWVDDGTIVRLNTATDSVSIGAATNSGKLHVTGSSTATNYMSLFSQNGITPEASYAAPTLQNKMISVQGDGGSYYMGRDVTNDIEFLMGTSSAGGCFVGAMTSGHNLWLRTNNANRVTVQSGDGYVGIGVAAPSYRLELPNTATVAGQGRANAWATYSDNRIKANQSPLVALDLVLRMRPIRYNPVNTSHDDDGRLTFDEPQTDEWRTGIVAQELHEIAPELVRVPEDEDTDLWTVDYGGIVPLLVSAIKEQNGIINKLTKRIESLEARK